MSAPAIMSATVKGSSRKRTATNAPTNGATEKYADVRDVPSSRSAYTNNARLKP